MFTHTVLGYDKINSLGLPQRHAK